VSSAGASTALEASLHTVHIRVSFHADGEHQAQTLAAKLIDSAHEIANMPEYECDVDVSVETSPPESSPVSGDTSGARSHGRPSNF
jgi:hypothetical protein